MDGPSKGTAKSTKPAIRRCIKSPRKEVNMPKALENKLKAEAKKKFGSDHTERARAYIYGTLRDTGWKPKREIKK